MTGKENAGSPRLVLDRLLGPRNQTLARGDNLDDAGDDLVRILMKLASDVERFDSMVVHQRKMLERRAAHPAGFDDDQTARRSDQLSLEAAQRLSLEAGEMVACVREALAQLRRASQTAKVPRA